MVDFELSETEQQLKETAEKFAQDIAKVMRTSEKKRAVDDALQNQYVELGFPMMDYAEDHGGLGLGVRARVVVGEALGVGDPGGALALPGAGAAGRLIAALGKKAQIKQYLMPFAGGEKKHAALVFHPLCFEVDPAGISITYTKQDKDFVLNGVAENVLKGAEADLYVVIARPDAEIKDYKKVKAFIVDKGAFAVEKTPETCGVEAARIATLKADNIKVTGDRELKGDLAKELGRALAAERLWAASLIVGTTRAANAYAIDYAQERKAFGQAIAQFQGLAFMIADSKMMVEAMQGIVWEAAWALDTGQNEAEARAAAALLHCIECGDKIATDSVQTLGGAGFVQDYPVEKAMRDVRTLGVLFGNRLLLQEVAANVNVATWQTIIA